MPEFLEIKCMKREDQKKILEEIERRIKIKIEDGKLTDREVREIEQMKLRPLPDIQDVQSVYENLEFEE
jgi:hypothetical protein